MWNECRNVYRIECHRNMKNALQKKFWQVNLQRKRRRYLKQMATAWNLEVLQEPDTYKATARATFARLTQSQAISQSFRAFISFRSRRDTTFFSFFENSFLYKITVSFTMVIKRSPGGQACRWRAINFEIHLVKFRQERWLHIWRSICIQHVQMEAGLNSDPGNDSFSDKIRDAKHVDRSTQYVCIHVDRRRWRAHQLTYDLKRCLLFRKCLRFFESEKQFRCLRLS